jgi:hypothetical protein
MMGQILKRFDHIQGSPKDEYSQPNKRKGSSQQNQGSKQQGQAELTKHFAGKAKAGRKSKKSFASDNSFDDSEKDSVRRAVIHKAYQARA